MEYSYANASEDKKAIIRSYIDAMRTDFEILPMSFDAAPLFGELKKAFKDDYSATNSSSKTDIRRTLRLHSIDFVLAATAICNQLVLVSADELFPNLARVDSRLKVEDWRS
jgi:predicted nucleic acid-binding protein